MEFMCDLRFPRFYGFEKEHSLSQIQLEAVETKVSPYLKTSFIYSKVREINIDFTDKVKQMSKCFSGSYSVMVDV